MTTMNADLLVALKGADLTASTAYLALRDRMGFGDRLVGLRRFDLFRLGLEAADPNAALANLKTSLDRQSTFYNRNKHHYALECHWDNNAHIEGLARADIRERWVADLANYLQNKQDRDFDGKASIGHAILSGSLVYLVEVMVEDHDESARESVAARLQRDLTRFPETENVTVTCHNRATLWWLAIVAGGPDEAREVANEMTVAHRRDAGLLMNPHFQHAEFISVEEIALVSS